MLDKNSTVDIKSITLPKTKTIAKRKNVSLFFAIDHLYRSSSYFFLIINFPNYAMKEKNMLG